MGCDDSLRPDTEPGPISDADGKKVVPQGATTNPLSRFYTGATPQERRDRLELSTKLAAELAKAGTTKSTPLGKQQQNKGKTARKRFSSIRLRDDPVEPVQTNDVRTDVGLPLDETLPSRGHWRSLEGRL
jgi:hypothetical protein